LRKTTSVILQQWLYQGSGIDFCTISVVPQAAPQLLLKATSPTSLRATWAPLSKEKAQGVVREYKVQWRREGQASSRVEQVKGDITDFTITGKCTL
jgi:hypothetical protein